MSLEHAKPFLHSVSISIKPSNIYNSFAYSSLPPNLRHNFNSFYLTGKLEGLAKLSDQDMAFFHTCKYNFSTNPRRAITFVVTWFRARHKKSFIRCIPVKHTRAHNVRLNIFLLLASECSWNQSLCISQQFISRSKNAFYRLKTSGNGFALKFLGI